MNTQAKALIGLWLLTILLTAAPGVVALLRVGDWSSGEKVVLLAHHIYGSPYYDARLREIGEGRPFIGNPYFKAHRDEPAPAFFVADWIAAFPQFLGLSLEGTTLLNVFVWATIFVFLAYMLLRELGVSVPASALGALFAFSQGYFLLIIPVSMQTVFPFFLLLLLSFAVWFKRQSIWSGLFFAASAALTLYVYTYLELIALSFMTLIGLALLLAREWRLFTRYVSVGIAAAALATPAVLYALVQLRHPFYWETMERIGLTSTRLPTSDAVITSLWPAAAVALWILTYLFVKGFREEGTARVAFYCFVLSGIALIVATLSNVATAKDLELPGHISRFTTIWLPLALVSYASLMSGQLPLWGTLFRFTRTSIIAVLAVSLLGVVYFSRNWLTFFRSRDDSAAYYEQFRGMLPVLRALAADKEPKVVLADPDDPLTSYVPVFTPHYVVFANAGILHLLSSEEADDRYLAASMFKDLTLSLLERDFYTYGGAGRASHQSGARNRGVKVCRLLQLSRLGVDCGKEVSAISLQGERYFVALLDRFRDTIRGNPESLRRFEVSYVVRNKDLQPENEEKYRALMLRSVYEDASFAVYKVPHYYGL